MFVRTCSGACAAVVVVLAGCLAISATANADEADAKSRFKAMSDYMAQQTAISFDYDTNLEFVTKDRQKLMLASSGTVDLKRPDQIRATRRGGFASVELIFDGRTLTVLHRDANLYAQAEVPGSLDHLIDDLRERFHKPVPGADLLMSNIYDQLMPGVIDVKDLGSGVIGGTECDHFAFRNQDVDWQIWIAQGDRPYPCRYVITAKQVDQAPEYSVQISNWKTGGEVKTDDFAFGNATSARKIDPKELGNVDELPNEFRGAAQ
jgi:hypothetical protein